MYCRTLYAVRRMPYAVCRTAVRRTPHTVPYALCGAQGGGGVAAVRRAAVRRMLYANLKIRGIAHILRIGGLRLTILDAEAINKSIRDGPDSEVATRQGIHLYYYQVLGRHPCHYGIPVGITYWPSHA
jgi:hypothetical protein